MKCDTIQPHLIRLEVAQQCAWLVAEYRCLSCCLARPPPLNHVPMHKAAVIIGFIVGVLSRILIVAAH